MNPALALVLANIIWGFASPIFKLSLENVPPYTLAFLRFGGAALIFLPFISVRKLLNIKPHDILTIFAASFIGLSVHIMTFLFGLQRAPSINSAIIYAGAPVFLFVLAVIFLGEKVVKKHLFGMIIALAGVMIIVLAPLWMSNPSVDSQSTLLGNILFVISVVTDIVGILIVKKTLMRVDPYRTTFLMFLFAAFTFFPFALLEQQTWSFAQLDAAGVGGIIYGIFLSSAAAYGLYFYGLSKMPAEETGIFIYIDPVATVVLAAPLLHEYPDLFFFIGATLVFCGLFISEGRIPYHPFYRLRRYLYATK